ncbi:hypothetical protein JTB14_034376 [Gonioctena quinquepunctata]|nr:hypothetical protein JTB14_034376 [Gonioctena quinquepunctata]
MSCMRQDDKQLDGFRKCEECTKPTIRNLMMKIIKIGDMNKDLAKSLNCCHEWIDENNALIKRQDLKIQELNGKLECLERKCIYLESENTEIKFNLNKQNSTLDSIA